MLTRTRVLSCRIPDDVRGTKSTDKVTSAPTELRCPWAYNQSLEKCLSASGTSLGDLDNSEQHARGIMRVLKKIWQEVDTFQGKPAQCMGGSSYRQHQLARSCLPPCSAAGQDPQYCSEKALAALLAANGGHVAATGSIAMQMELAADTLVWEVDCAFHALRAAERLTPMVSLRTSQSQACGSVDTHLHVQENCSEVGSALSLQVSTAHAHASGTSQHGCHAEDDEVK